MISELLVLLDGTNVGRVRRDRNGRLSFIYDEAWRRGDASYPLSLSMPLTEAAHGHTTIEPFLWGLLPDNETILQRWGRRFHVSPRNAFALISHVGEDCAGAVQLFPEERLATVRNEKRAKVDWLDESAVARRLHSLRVDASAWRDDRDTGQFSLAGAQPKTALLFDRGRWGVPSGRTPTTHILKPPTTDFDGFAENEHICLQLARALNLPAAGSAVRRFGDEIAIVVERYDRIRAGSEIRRVHQEDMCQVLAIPPIRKYQNEGGPGAREIVDVLRRHSSAPDEDVRTFVDALGLNWMIAGTDAHAKNYGILITPDSVRLAPLYDLTSALPYDRLDQSRLKLAMNVGGQYRLRNIGRSKWEKLARETRLDTGEVIARLRAMARALPDQAADVRRKAAAEGLRNPILERLTKKLVANAKDCRDLLDVRSRAET